MGRQNNRCPLQRVSNVNTIYGHNLQANVDELTAYENMITYVCSLETQVKEGLFTQT